MSARELIGRRGTTRHGERIVAACTALDSARVSVVPIDDRGVIKTECETFTPMIDHVSWDQYREPIGPALPTSRDLMGAPDMDVSALRAMSNYRGPWINRSGLRVEGKMLSSGAVEASTVAPNRADIRSERGEGEALSLIVLGASVMFVAIMAWLGWTLIGASDDAGDYWKDVASTCAVIGVPSYRMLLSRGLDMMGPITARALGDNITLLRHQWTELAHELRPTDDPTSLYHRIVSDIALREPDHAASRSVNELARSIARKVAAPEDVERVVDYEASILSPEQRREVARIVREIKGYRSETAGSRETGFLVKQLYAYGINVDPDCCDVVALRDDAREIGAGGSPLHLAPRGPWSLYPNLVCELMLRLASHIEDDRKAR